MMVGTMSDLFSAAVERHLKSRAPLAARLRPRSIDEIVGQQHLVGEGAPLRLLVELLQHGDWLLELSVGAVQLLPLLFELFHRHSPHLRRLGVFFLQPHRDVPALL